MKTASVETGVRIPVGTPTEKTAQAAEKSGDASEKEASPFSFPEVRGQKFYPLTSAAQDGISTDASVSAVPTAQKSEADSLNSEASVTNTDVRLRSQPIQINPITYDSGNPGYLVVGTVVPKQKPWREKFRDRAKAEQRQREWEDERIRMAAGMQMRATELSNNALRDAEAAHRRSFSRRLGGVSDTPSFDGNWWNEVSCRLEKLSRISDLKT